MSIDFICSGCSKTLRVPDEHLGKQARCPHCQTLNVIQPDESTFEPVPAYPRSSDNPFAGLADRSDDKRKHATGGGDNPYQSTSSIASRRPNQLPHRGGIILSLGICSLVCNVMLIPGIMAWVMGRGDLAQMKAGVMDREGEGLTTAGMIMGMIMTCIAAVSFLVGIVIMVFVFVAAIVGAN